MNTNKKTTQQGFAMLFTVMLVGIILAIAIGIAEITFKQTILSNLASDSQLSFFQADTAMECGMLYEYAPIAGIDPKYLVVGGEPLVCGAARLEYIGVTPEGAHRFEPSDFFDRGNTRACFALEFNKSTSPRTIEAFGYNNCDPASPRQVERALRVLY